MEIHTHDLIVYEELVDREVYVYKRLQEGKE